jgi:acyl-CoA hydrolase
MNLNFETNFTVMPTDANYAYPLIFGGNFGGELDLCAAQTANRFLHDSVCDAAVTHKWSITFSKPTYVGDLIFMRGVITSVGHKSICIRVTADREKRGKAGRDRVAEADYVFISCKNLSDLSDKPDMLPYHPHGLTLPEGYEPHVD